MSRDPKRAFAQLYHDVFDESGTVKLVGRSKCSELIRAAKKVSLHYGNEETGWMDPENIKALYAELFPEGIEEEDW